MSVSSIIAGAMQAEAIRVDILANNLANASTPGFRKLLVLDDGKGVQTVPDTAQGSVQDTGKRWDLLIEGSGFFVLDVPGQGLRLTRRGRFHVDDSGTLVSAEGYPVQGDGGAVKIPPGDVEVRPDGSLISQGQPLGRLRLSNPTSDTPLTPVGTCLFSVPDGALLQAAPGKITQGSLEGSNVDPLREMTTFMESIRFFQMGQKVIQTADDVSKKLTDDVGHSKA